MFRRGDGTYVTIGISSYLSDVAQSDAIVDALKAAGVTKASRSWVIREAVRRLDVPAFIADVVARGK